MALDIKNLDGFRKKDGGVSIPNAPRMKRLPNSRAGTLMAKEKGYKFIVPGDQSEYTPRTTVGVTTWKNKKNKFFTVRLHYTADPAKRHQRWAEEGRKENPQKWDQDMEIDFRSKTGLKVFGEFSWEPSDCDCRHNLAAGSDPRLTLRPVVLCRGGFHYSSSSNVIRPFSLPDWSPLYLATDPGRRAAWATAAVRVDDLDIWFVWKSVVQRGLGYRQAKKRISSVIGRHHVVEHVIDHQASERRTETERTLLQLMSEPPHPMDCIPIAHRSDEYVQIDILRDRMSRRSDGRFGVYFMASGTDNGEVVRQFRQCVYGKGERILSEDVDSVDALKYLATHRLDKAVRPRKPASAMRGTELAAHRVLQSRRKAEAALKKSQKLYDKGQGPLEGMYGW